MRLSYKSSPDHCQVCALTESMRPVFVPKRDCVQHSLHSQTWMLGQRSKAVPIAAALTGDHS